jgi:AraC family ethanolamine operon transcriptional activator
MNLEARSPARNAPPPTLLRRATRDVDEQAALLTQWNQHYDQLSQGTFRGGLTEVTFNGVRLFREVTDQSLFQRGALPADVAAFGVPLAMQGAGTFAGRACDLQSIHVFSGAPGFEFCSSRRLDMAGISLPGERIAGFAAEVERVDIEDRLQRPHLLRVDPGAIEAMRVFLQSVFELLEGSGASWQSARWGRSMEAALVSNLSRVLTSMDERGGELPSLTRRCRIVERAKEYVLEHADEPVQVADLCRALGVSRRTLQYCFQEVLETNPATYLRAIRLNAARRDIKALASVTDAAFRWGFWHPSHFAADYRRMFGELPSETAERARRLAARV